MALNNVHLVIIVILVDSMNAVDSPKDEDLIEEVK